MTDHAKADANALLAVQCEAMRSITTGAACPRRRPPP